jgi:general secretion pathway protein H
LTALSADNNKNGFSMMEIVIVIAIIGGIIAAIVPTLTRKKPILISQVTRDIIIKFKQVRNSSKLYGTTYRFAFRLTKDNQAYWIEKSANVTLIDKKALDAEREKEKSNFRPDHSDEKSAAAFQPDTTFFKKEQTLASGYSFKSIETGGLDAVITDGTAYIHFFPQGYIEPSLIQIEDPKKNIWTLVFNPITGQADLIAEAKTLKDLNR